MDESSVLARLAELEIETPSWGYGNSGTRFHVYPWPGAARTVHERIADAALVHRLTGCCPTVALHIPWDAVDDYGELRAYAESEGIGIGAINPNLFGEDDYRLGSLCNPDEAVRARAGAPLLECLEIAAGGLDDRQPLARRRHELPGPGRSPAPACPAARRAGAGLPGSARRDTPARRVQFSSRPSRPICRTGNGRPGVPPQGRRLRCSTPATRKGQHRADRRAAARGRAARRLPFQQPVRGRRPDHQFDRPVRAVPDHARDRARRPGRHRLHDRPVHNVEGRSTR